MIISGGEKKSLLLFKILFLILLFQVYFDNSIIVMMIAIIYMYILINKEKKIFKFDRVQSILILFFVLLMISYIFNFVFEVKNLIMFIKVVFSGFFWIFCAFIAYTFGKYLYSTKKFDKIINFLVNLFFINAIVNIFQWIIETNFSFGRYNFTSPITLSVSGGITYSMLGILLLLGNKSFGKNRKLIYYSAFFFNFIIIITRASQVELVFCLLIYFGIIEFFFDRKEKKFKISYLFIGSILLIVVAFNIQDILAFFNLYYSRIFDPNGSDILSRQSAIITAKRMFEINPIFGMGYGMFGEINKQEYLGRMLGSAHNGFYSIISEMGIVGLFLIILLIISIMKTSMKIIRTCNVEKLDAAIISLLSVSTIFFFVKNSVFFPPPSEYSYYFVGVIYWMLFGYLHAKAFD